MNHEALSSFQELLLANEPLIRVVSFLVILGAMGAWEMAGRRCNPSRQSVSSGRPRRIAQDES